MKISWLMTSLNKEFESNEKSLQLTTASCSYCSQGVAQARLSVPPASATESLAPRQAHLGEANPAHDAMGPHTAHDTTAD